MQPGMKIAFSSSTASEVKSIQMFHNNLQDAQPGDSVGFNVENVSAKDLKRGMVVGNAENDPPKVCKSFKAQVIIVNHPGEIHKG